MKVIPIDKGGEFIIVEPSGETWSGLPRKGITVFNCRDHRIHICVMESDGELGIAFVTAAGAGELNTMEPPEEYGDDTI